MFDSADDKFFEAQKTLTEKWQRPDFKKGVSVSDAITYFRKKAHREDLAIAAEKVQKFERHSNPVLFVIAPPSTAAYIFPGVRETFYNLYTLQDPEADPEHILGHEQIHHNQYEAWGSMDIPGFHELSDHPYILALFARQLGITVLNERDIVEGLTESLATDKTRFDPSCAYNSFQVPLVENSLEKLISDVTGQSISGIFGNMHVSGNRERFRLALLETANYLVFEDEAKMVAQGKLDDNQLRNVRAIASCAFREKRVFSPEHARDFLFGASVGLAHVGAGVYDGIKIVLPLPEQKTEIIIEGIGIDGTDIFGIEVSDASDIAVKKLVIDKADQTSDILGGFVGHKLPLGA